MKIPTIIAVIFLTASSCLAEQPSILITEQGYFLLIVKNGIPTIQQPSRVIDTRTNSPDPSPNPTPTPSPTSPDPDLTKQSKEWAVTVNDSNSAQALALVYRQIEESVRSNNLSIQAGSEALSTATNSVLTLLGTVEQWAGFRESASKELSTRMSQGTVSQPTQFANFLLAIAFGLELAANNSEALNFSQLLEIVSQTNIAIDKAKE